MFPNGNMGGKISKFNENVPAQELLPNFWSECAKKFPNEHIVHWEEPLTATLPSYGGKLVTA
jgi:hypothetical protein